MYIIIYIYIYLYPYIYIFIYLFIYSFINLHNFHIFTFWSILIRSPGIGCVVSSLIHELRGPWHRIFRLLFGPRHIIFVEGAHGEAPPPA